MRNLFQKTSARRDGGYTLLFAMIVASVVLALGVSLLSVSRKEFLLSSSANESSAAFYAADSGLSCAEYWDSTNSGDAFATSSANLLTNDGGTQTTATPVACSVDPTSGDLQSFPVTWATEISLDVGITITPGDNPIEFSFSVPFSTDGTTNQSCALVTVDKYDEPDPDQNNMVRPFTTITSRGYNLGWDGTSACSVLSPKKVNRTIQLTY